MARVSRRTGKRSGAGAGRRRKQPRGGGAGAKRSRPRKPLGQRVRGEPGARAAGSDTEREVLYGVHPVAEALEVRRRVVERLLVARDTRTAGVGRVLRLAREAGVPITHVPRSVLGRRLGRAAAHQGVAALVSPVPYADADELCRAAGARADGLLVLLDRIEDPGNLGAALRTAAAAGVHGLILSGSGTVGLTPTVAKASAGALERVPVARDPRLRRRLEGLREAGFAGIALDPRGDAAWWEVDLRGPVAIVAGGEARGIGPAIARACDRRVRIPLAPGVESLNVSVALGILLFEAVRQRAAPRGA